MTRHLVLLTLVLLTLVAMLSPAASAMPDSELQLAADALFKADQPEAVGPLSQLAARFFEAGENSLALDALQKAQYVMHQHAGVWTPYQVPLINNMILVQMRQGDYLGVQDLQEFRFAVAEKQHGPDAPILARATTILANWYTQTDQHERSLALHRRSVSLARRDSSGSRETLITALQSLSTALFLADKCCAGEPLAEVYRILLVSTDADQVERQQAALEAADLLLLTGNTEQAYQLYSAAYTHHPGNRSLQEPELIGYRSNDVMDAAFPRRNQYFASVSGNRVDQINLYGRDPGFTQHQLVGNPIPLCEEHVNALMKQAPTGLDTQIEFTVLETGRVTDVKLVTEGIPVTVKRYLKSLLQATVFRPRIENGAPTKTEGIRIKETFEKRMMSGAQNKDRNLMLAYSGCTASY